MSSGEEKNCKILTVTLIFVSKTNNSCLMTSVIAVTAYLVDGYILNDG